MQNYIDKYFDNRVESAQHTQPVEGASNQAQAVLFQSNPSMTGPAAVQMVDTSVHTTQSGNKYAGSSCCNTVSKGTFYSTRAVFVKGLFFLLVLLGNVAGLFFS